MKRTRTDLAKLIYGHSPLWHRDHRYLSLSRDSKIDITQKWVCDGCSRERIILNPQSKELHIFFIDFLKKAGFYQEVRQTDATEMNTQPWEMEENFVQSPSMISIKSIDLGVLIKIISYVATFFMVNTSEQNLQRLIAQHLKVASITQVPQKDRIIPLEYFLLAKEGLCRQQALLVGYLLAVLQNNIPGSISMGDIYRFRTELEPLSGETPRAAHAVIVYEQNGRRYLLDSTRQRFQQKGIVLDITEPLDPNARDIINKHYTPYNGAYLIKQINQTYDKKGEINLNESSTPRANR